MMKILVMSSMLIMLISLLMISVNTMISKKTFMDREKSSPFECGFDPKSSARIPFSIQFFLISMIFLIFDIEITLLMPFILTMKISNMLSFMFMSTFFLMVLLLGLFHEWNQGSLNWVY
uniref:NADH-ubiquinone oxidoreductase chain 3 n=1 Tax=Eurypogon sp. EUR01 TaxID=1205553 RepID=A0A0S2MQU3_9COLE|nr:NADH deshydrogenase subunit 3 [Eurypogon sp. EUR01]